MLVRIKNELDGRSSGRLSENSISFISYIAIQFVHPKSICIQFFIPNFIISKLKYRNIKLFRSHSLYIVNLRINTFPVEQFAISQIFERPTKHPAHKEEHVAINAPNNFITRFAQQQWHFYEDLCPRKITLRNINIYGLIFTRESQPYDI